MIDTKNVEIFFDIINEACCFLFEKKKMNYYDALIENTNNILNQDISTEFRNDDDLVELQKIYDKLEEINFNVEEIRKAMQYLLIRCFKELKLINPVTPDTIGFFMAYLANKFFKKKEIAILDICLGTANLLTTIANQLDSPTLYGIDSEEMMTNIAKMNANMQNTDISIFLQNTLDSHISNMDLIVGDIPSYVENDTYFPYEAILYHKDSLKENGYMMLLVSNDFFSYDSGFFKKAFELDMQMFGVIELPDSLFVENKKSILLIQKTKVKKKNFLMVKIPDFNNQELMNNTLTKIEEWFKGENYYD